MSKQIILALAIAIGAATLSAIAQTTTFHDRAGRVIGKARTDSNGVTTYYDANGRVVGKASAPR